MPDEWDSTEGQTHLVGDGCTPAHTSAAPAARRASSGLWARYGLEQPAYEGLDDLGEPCELCGYGTQPSGPLEWELVECQWCRARVRVHVQCDERVRHAFPQVDCPRCGHVWPDWWKLAEVLDQIGTVSP